ncbi:probable tubulin polyglutamylase TTLL2 [Struthio camelus]|uniref:probable tubulin polyglutamylase TTLL2 n=1 Tax=Struthio camelus TaxID=8801 RepID=UPI00051E4EBD|nr:PREDICTED: probable tubulin polyglutamylase TTLL2 [Struthio camelus australis]XP_009684177.1 PREDICTED: probable tubulin polyglutamylase TTLL2 [Struthio camelus australis]
MMADHHDAREILKPLVFRLHENVPAIVREVLLERGWTEFDKKEQDDTDWNLYWRNSPFRMTDYCSIKPWQRLNHYPEAVRITRKDYLARHLKRMKGAYGSALYEFSPVAFIMPNDYVKFIAEYFKEKQSLGRRPSYWICKPVDLSRGRGILIFQDIKDFEYDCTVIVQKYISNPLLISGYKLDLRLYVCVTSFCPLTIYTYEEGLVRFATEKFDLSSLDNVFSHLTNTSINKYGASYKKYKEGIGCGCKWTFSKFRSYLRIYGVDDLLLWKKINNIVMLTLLAVTPLPAASNCFELFGFDILIDDKFKPWLLEVNYNPALCLDCSIDATVKRKLLHDIVELLNYKQIDALRQNQMAGTKAGRARVPLSTPGESALEEAPDSHTCQGEAECTAPSSVQSALQVAKGSIHKVVTQTKKIARGHPRKTLTSQLRERMNMPKTSSQAKAEAKSKQLPEAVHYPHQFAQPSRWLPTPDFWNCKLTTHPYFLSDKDQRPIPRVGDFVLIFPFNEAALQASRDGTDVKSIIQEINKLVNKQLPSKKQKTKKRVDSLTSV